MSRTYTRTGDDGTTGLVGGGRAPKDSPLIETVGDIDELTAHIGVARSLSLSDDIDSILHAVQERLLIIGTTVADPDNTNARRPKICDTDILKLENDIDRLQSRLPPLDRFIIPGEGAPAGAYLHLVRTAARRVERGCVALSRVSPVAPELLRWLNRLSDLFFVLARIVNQEQSTVEKSSDVLYRET